MNSGVSLRSLYMLRDNAGAGAFSHADLAAIAAPYTPGWPKREPVFGGRSAPPAGIFHLGSLGSIPRIRQLEAGAGALNLGAFALAAVPAPAPGIGGPYPSFGPVNPNAPPAPGQPDGQAVTPPARVIGYVPAPPPPPPVQNIPKPVPTPAPSTGLGGGALLVGGAVLALLFLGTQDKKKRRRRA